MAPGPDAKEIKCDSPKCKKKVGVAVKGGPSGCSKFVHYFVVDIKWRVTFQYVPGGVATCSRRFCLLFSERGCWAVPCTPAAMLPKQAMGTFRKHITKPSEQVAAPPSIVGDLALV